jgi:hypothetical protein
VKRELERIEIPGERGARERSWAVVAAAFAEREPQPRRRSWKPIAAVAIAAAAVAGLLSPPGRAVLDELREVVGVEESAPALFSLPAPGRLLVTADSGAWVVEQDGSKRLLGRYREASWSPFGRFVVAARPNELAALTPDGSVRWTLARPDVRLPRWGGTQTDTRIAYFSGGELRVVGGDGEGDRLLDVEAAERAPVWQQGAGHRLAYARRDGTVRVVDADTGAVVDRDAAVSLLERRAAIVSPDGRWTVVGWADADQLVFTRLGRPRQIRAVSDVSAQFRSRSFPTLEGWCCAP